MARVQRMGLEVSCSALQTIFSQERDAATLFHALVNTGTSVKLFLVLDSDVNDFSSKVPDNLLSVPGTKAIHQWVTHEPYKIASRVVGCLCENDLMCSCYNTNIFQLPTQEHKNTLTNQRRK